MSQNLTGSAFGGNFILSRAGGATANISGITGAASTYTVQNVTYSNQGLLFYKATAAGAATPTTDANTGVAFKAQAINTVCAYLWGLNQAGAVGVVQGLIVAWTNTAAGSTPVPMPEFTDAYTPVAYTIVENGASGSAFTFGTSLWNQSGATATTADLFSLPASAVMSP